MIYMTVSIKPEKSEEQEIVSLSLMRLERVLSTDGKDIYTYGGSWTNREGERKHFCGSIVSKRENSIFDLIGKICMDIEESIS